MARKRLIPGFETAPGPHRAMVRDGSKYREIIFPNGSPTPPQIKQAEQDLGTKRMLASRIGSLGLSSPLPAAETAATAAGGWRSLKEGTWAWLDGHLATVAIPKYRSAFLTEAQAHAHVAEAARDGASTVVAFTEVVGKVLVNREFKDPNAEIAEWARASVGFSIEWAGLDDMVDLRLAWALASPKPRKPEFVFDDLHFDPRYFAADDELRRVGIDPAKAPNLRDEENRRPHRRDSRRPLFPCPADAMIPRLHSMIVDEAEAAGLFGRTYLEERAQCGYAEAWAELEAVRPPQPSPVEA
jgi:hypothetical protein